MQLFSYPNPTQKKILALGAESNGNFSFFANGQLLFSPDFGDLFQESNFKHFTMSLSTFIRDKKIQPDIILTDHHPLMHTTLFGAKLAKKYQAQHISVQHHQAHVFSAIGEKLLQNKSIQIPSISYGIAMDGTGLGSDKRIWGGEIFKIKHLKFTTLVERIGHLENQTLLGGELAIREPTRMLLAILAKFLSKQEVFVFIKKYYSASEFEVLWNQLQQNFNCLETSSTGRILDAVSLLLGFCHNERNFKHEAIELLEKNSTTPYLDIKPIIAEISPINYQLQTTDLFRYLIRNLHQDKSRLAATAQYYLAQGLCDIIEQDYDINASKQAPIVYAAGGITNNAIIANYLLSKNTILNQKIPRGDAGLSFGQIFWFLLTVSD